MANSSVFSEDKVGAKIDRCFSDAVIKAGKFKIGENYELINFADITFIYRCWRFFRHYNITRLL